MKKILLIVLISFNSYAAYMPESNIGSGENSTVWLKKSKCEKANSPDKCIKISDPNTGSHAKIIAEEAIEKNNTVCLIDCADEMAALICDEGYSQREGTLTVYCEKIIPRHVGFDEGKKAMYDAKILKSKNREIKIRKGQEKRAKCQMALDLLNGSFEASTESEEDALRVLFKNELKALKAHNRRKAKKLFSLVDNPAFNELRDEILEVLE